MLGHWGCPDGTARAVAALPAEDSRAQGRAGRPGHTGSWPPSGLTQARWANDSQCAEAMWLVKNAFPAAARPSQGRSRQVVLAFRAGQTRVRSSQGPWLIAWVKVQPPSRLTWRRAQPRRRPARARAFTCSQGRRILTGTAHQQKRHDRAAQANPHAIPRPQHTALQAHAAAPPPTFPASLAYLYIWPPWGGG